MAVFTAFYLTAMASVLLANESPIRFEAEDVTVTPDAWAENEYGQTKWNLWSTDKDAAKSGPRASYCSHHV